MKNIDKPVADKFVLTIKKKKMIQSYMNDFIKSKEYELFIDMFYTPSSFELKNFLINGCKFLTNINFFLGIETINNYWTGHVFQYNNEAIETKTKARQIFTNQNKCGELIVTLRGIAEPEKLTSREIFKILIMKPTEGRIVTFKPSERTKERFRRKQKDSYPAVVTDVNENSVDLTVFGVGETIHVSNVKITSEAAENHSSWDWPAKVENVTPVAPVAEKAKEPEAKKAVETKKQTAPAKKAATKE